KRDDRTLYWRDARVESQDNPSLHFSILIRRLVLRVHLADECQHSSIDTGARLDYVRNKFLFRLLVEIFERLSAGLLMLRQIVIRSVSNALKLLPPERKLVFDVVSSF